jgi:hypothetical protein
MLRLAWLGSLLPTALIVPLLSAQQQAVVQGRVVDSDGYPIAGSRVILAAWSAEAITDSAGRFEFRTRLNAGCWRLNATFLGYKIQNTYVLLRPGSQNIGDVLLHADPGDGYPVIERRCAGTEDTYTGMSWPVLHGGVTGRIVDQSGAPIRAHHVRAYCSLGGSVEEPDADSLGRYSFFVYVTHDELIHRAVSRLPRSLACQLGFASGMFGDSVIVEVGPWSQPAPVTNLGTHVWKH